MKVSCGVAARGSGSKLNEALSPHPIPGAHRLQNFSSQYGSFFLLPLLTVRLPKKEENEIAASFRGENSSHSPLSL